MPPRRVAVVSRPGADAGPDAGADVGAWLLPDDEVAHHVFAGDVDDLHLRMVIGGPVDLVVDRAGRGGVAGRFTTLLWHVVPGGRLVTRLPAAGGPHDRSRRTMLDLVGAVTALRDGGADGRGPQPPVLVRTDTREVAVRDLHALAASLASLEVRGDEVVAVPRVRTLATVPEAGFDDVLAARPDLGRTLHTEPGATWTPRGRLVSDDPAVRGREQYAAPPLRLRAMHDVVCAPRQVAVGSTMVLPASFRDPTRGRLHVRSLVDWSRRAVLAPDLAVPQDLPGVWFHLDNVMRGHFGHALTEQLSLTWAWQEARARHPDVRALVFPWPGHPVAPWELTLLEAAGISPDDVVAPAGPVRVRTLLTATPAYAIGSYVHPRLGEVWARAGAALEAAAAPGPRPRRVFVSRRPDKRVCLDAPAVEAIARRHGFEVVLPETRGLPEQVALVRSADVVAGYAGSGLFHLALAERPRPVVVVSSRTYPAANERQICAFHGHDLTWVRGRSQVDAPAGSLAAFHSDYTLDADQLAGLDHTLGSLAAGSA